MGFLDDINPVHLGNEVYSSAKHTVNSIGQFGSDFVDGIEIGAKGVYDVGKGIYNKADYLFNNAFDAANYFLKSPQFILYLVGGVAIIVLFK